MTSSSEQVNERPIDEDYSFISIHKRTQTDIVWVILQCVEGMYNISTALIEREKKQAIRDELELHDLVADDHHDEFISD